MRLNYQPLQGKPYSFILDDVHRSYLESLMKFHQMDGAKVLRMLIREAHRKQHKQKAPGR